MLPSRAAGAVRDPRLHERGRQVLLHRQERRLSSTRPRSRSYYDPFENRDCAVTATSVAPFCRPLFGSGDGVNDVLEYWFGAGLVNVGAGANFDDQTTPMPSTCSASTTRSPVCPGASTAPAGREPGRHLGPNSFITTSGLLPATSTRSSTAGPSARYDRPGGPFDPHTGDFTSTRRSPMCRTSG